MVQFTVGHTVSVRPAGRDRQIGALVKYNKKTVTVITKSGQKWNVFPHLLSGVKDIKGHLIGDGKIIDIQAKGKQE